MGNSMTGLAGQVSGSAQLAPQVPAGPSPDDVDVVGQRVWEIAQEIDELRRELASLHATEWQSAASDAFQDRLAERTTALAAVVQDVQAAAMAVVAYAAILRAEATLRPGPVFVPLPGADFGAGPGSGAQG